MAVKVLILKTGHHDLLEPIVARLEKRGYAFEWEDIVGPRQMERADITWLSGLNLGGDRGDKIAEFASAAKRRGKSLVGYYLGDWTNMAAGRKKIQEIDWSGLSLCFQANPVLMAELRGLNPTADNLRWAYLPRALNPSYSFRRREKFGRRIGMWGQYGWWWKGAWWLIRSFGKLKDMARQDWELELWGCKPQFFKHIPQYVVDEARLAGVKLMGWSSRGELVEWVNTLDIVANASLSEGDSKPIGEGMLTGCYALVRNWPGAKDLYPGQYVVENEWDFVRRAMQWDVLSEDEKRRMSQETAEFARKKHDLGRIVDIVDREFRFLIGGDNG